MSEQLLEGLSSVAALLLQVAARQEHVPLQLATLPPLYGDADAAGAELAERGLVKDSPVDGVCVLSPMGLALREAVLARWPALHRILRQELLDHLVERGGVDPDSTLYRAFAAVDRADHIPEPARVLADLDLPAPTSVPDMTTSAPHALAAILQAVQPAPQERVLVCGGKGGMIAALAAHMVGPEGLVQVLDWDPDTVAHVEAAVSERAGPAARILARHQVDVTLGFELDPGWDVIIMNGSVPKIPTPLVDQLCPGGRLLLFLQQAQAHGQECFVVHAGRGVARDETLSAFVFTPIYGRWGWDRIEDLAARWPAEG